MTTVFPVKELARKLEGSDDPEFVTLLSSLRSPCYADERLLKSDLGLLVTKTLALLRASHDATIWRGCQTAVVICSYNPLVLCAHAGQLLAAIYSKLEHKVEYYSSTLQTPQSAVVLQALVFALSSLINLMRGKPTLSRENLVPQLKVIIPTLLKLAQVEPKLALPVLKTVLYKNTTTFRPFANKFRLVLSELLVRDYDRCDRETQRLICDNFAYLHLIRLAPSNGEDETQAHHKSYPDDTWKMGISSVLSQFKPILDLCGEFLDLEQDKDVQRLIQSLTLSGEGSKIGDFLPGLKLDMNSPLTLWGAPRRLSMLLDILSSFMTLPTPYPVRVPLGFCISVAESLLSMTSNYLPFKHDVRRDLELTSVIQEVLPQIQFVGVRLLSIITQTYGKLCLSMLPSILSSLELFIPLQKKSSKIDLEKCTSLKSEFLTVFRLVTSLASSMGHQLNEVELVKKLVEVSLHLTEDYSALNFNSSREIKATRSKDSKQKQKKDQQSTSISDLYVQPESFKFKCCERSLSDINRFLQVVMSSWKLPSTEHLKILKYSISAALKWKEQSGCVPKSYVELLRAGVLNPGTERVSILPIAVSLLKNANDDVFDSVCHPRLPMSLVHNVKASAGVTEEAAEETVDENHLSQQQAEPTIVITSIVEKIEQSSNRPHVSADQSTRTVTRSVVESIPSQDVISGSPVQVVPDSANSKKRELEEEAESEVVKRTKTNVVELAALTESSQSATTETLTEEDQKPADLKNVEEPEMQANDIASDEDSEFEIPAINVSDDEEGDDDSEE